MKIGIFGKGRLGRAIAQEVACASDLELIWHVGRGEAPTARADVALDASIGEAVSEHIDWALASGTDLVIGTTGWELPELGERIDRHIGALVAPNFSLGVALMARLATVMGRFAALDPELDPYILDHHHRAKADAPSGTAKRLAQAVMQGCPRKQNWTLATPEPQELSMAVVRAGSEFGMHTVGLDGPVEALTLVHRARSRALFAQGALGAARWLHGKKGLYTFDTYASEMLDPLFVFGDLP